MAQTYKFGAGTWANKEGSTLAYSDTNNAFKPLPFSFTRDSIGTRVNKEGLIEVVGKDKPRIDYTDSAEGVLLLEPTRSNRVTYSEDLTQWTDYNASAVLSEETIYGKKAYKIVEDNTLNYHGIYLTNLFGADGTNYIWSVYVKGAERRYVVLTARAGISSNESALIFDTQEGEWVLDNSGQNQAFSAESVGNGWWRIAIEGDTTSGAYDSYTIASATGFSSYLDANYQGDGTSGIYVSMPQVEAGAYPTSYIPTSGSTVQRAAETANGSGNSEVFNDSEGVLFADISALADTVSGYNSIGIGSSGSTLNRIGIGFEPTNEIYAYKHDGTNYWLPSATMNIKLYNKVALSYNTNDNHLWINGFKIVSNTTVGDMAQPTSLGFEASYGGEQFYGKTKEIGYYDTALTDAELEYMTSYRSLNELVTELNLNTL